MLLYKSRLMLCVVNFKGNLKYFIIKKNEILRNGIKNLFKTGLITLFKTAKVKLYYSILVAGINILYCRLLICQNPASAAKNKCLFTQTPRQEQQENKTRRARVTLIFCENSAFSCSSLFRDNGRPRNFLERLAGKQKTFQPL